MRREVFAKRNNNNNKFRRSANEHDIQFEPDDDQNAKDTSDVEVSNHEVNTAMVITKPKNDRATRFVNSCYDQEH